MEDCVLPSFVMAKRMSRSSFGEDEPCDTLELSMVSMMSAAPSPRKSKACQVEEREPPRAMMVWRHWRYCRRTAREELGRGLGRQQRSSSAMSRCEAAERDVRANPLHSKVELQQRGEAEIGRRCTDETKIAPIPIF